MARIAGTLKSGLLVLAVKSIYGSRLSPLDEFHNGPHPEPYVDETVLYHRLLKCFQSFARLYDCFRTWWANRRYSQYNRLRPKPHGVLADAISHFWTIKFSRKSNEGPPKVDDEAVRQLLIKYGELERANNPTLVQEMVNVARSETGRLDSEAFVNAVSSDLKEWVVGSEDLLSTHFEDVFGTTDPATVVQIRNKPTDDSTTADVEACNPTTATSHVKKKNVNYFARLVSWLWFLLTLGELFGYCSSTDTRVFAVEPSNVDSVLDAHSSLLACVLIWMFAITT
jgi:hypothetical protein